MIKKHETCTDLISKHDIWIPKLLISFIPWHLTPFSVSLRGSACDCFGGTTVLAIGRSADRAETIFPFEMTYTEL